MVGLADRRQRLDLVHCALLQFAILMQLLRRNYFYGILLIILYIFRTIYLPVVTLAYHLQ